MSDGRRTLAALAVALVVASAVVPALSSARPAHEIPIETVGGSVASPDAAGWSDVPVASVPLSSAPSGLPGADQTTTERVDVQAARNETHLSLRVRWPDATADVDATDPRAFADAVAVQLPVNTTERPAIAMGSTRNAVNVWYWNADAGREELLAGGAGTTTRFQNAAVSVETARVGEGDDGAWSVVFTRELRADGRNRTTVPTDRDLDVAFAVWNGSNGERSGHKAVSEWYYLATGPGPQGPPYEAILWTVAGIAVVATVAVTALGVYRTGEVSE